MKISIIAAIGKDRELGKNNKLLWHIPEDLKRFHSITRGHAVIMGRKTWESLPHKPLIERYNIVITRDTKYTIQNSKNVKVTSSLGEALQLATLTQGNDECFVIGGGQIYGQAISIADKLYLTIIEENFDADTFFPDYSQFKKIIFEKEGKFEKYKYKFLELEKQSAY
jgi:dihydrofolate reductase